VTHWSSKLYRNIAEKMPEKYNNYLIILDNNVIMCYISSIFKSLSGGRNGI